MSIHQTHESQIVARLAPLVTASLKVAVLPESETEAQRVPVGPSQATVYVAFTGTDYDNTQNIYTVNSTGAVEQVEYHKYEVILLSPKLRGPNGIYALIDAVKALLIGYKLQHTSHGMHIREVGFVDRKDDKNLFQFAMIFACKGMLVELTQDEVGPALQALTYIEESINIDTRMPIMVDFDSGLGTEDSKQLEA